MAKGQTLMVTDKKDGRQYKCKVVETCEEDVKVHYVGWKQSHDEWIASSSSRIVSLERAVPAGKQDSEIAFAAGLDGKLDEPVLTAGAPGDVAGRGGDAEASSDAASKCTCCSLPVHGESLVCCKCGALYHAERVCVGVEEEVIRLIVEDKKGAVTYCCCLCRSGGGRNKLKVSENEAISQLFNMVGGLVRQMKELSEALEHLRGGRMDVGESVGPGAAVAAGEVTRERLLEEVREVAEREKRKKSIILRGFDCKSDETLQIKFDRVCEALGLDVVQLEDVVAIRAHGIFRARILSDEARVSLLREVKRLRHMEGYERCYIQKDLTYRQRKELVERRREWGSSRGGGWRGCWWWRWCGGWGCCYCFWLGWWCWVQ